MASPLLGVDIQQDSKHIFSLINAYATIVNLSESTDHEMFFTFKERENEGIVPFWFIPAVHPLPSSSSRAMWYFDNLRSITDTQERLLSIFSTCAHLLGAIPGTIVVDDIRRAQRMEHLLDSIGISKSRVRIRVKMGHDQEKIDA